MQEVRVSGVAEWVHACKRLLRGTRVSSGHDSIGVPCHYPTGSQGLHAED